MTEEEQRIAIAEFCGVAMPIYKGKDIKWGGVNKGTLICDVPDYLHDLNVMHEAEEKLSIDQTYTYLTSLELITHGRLRFDPHDWIRTALIVHATAAQRAEALLKTIGRWKD